MSFSLNDMMKEAASLCRAHAARMRKEGFNERAKGAEQCAYIIRRRFTAMRAERMKPRSTT